MFRSWAGYLSALAEEKAGIKLEPMQLDLFCRYGQLLLEWNEKLNLTAITEPVDIILKHFIDSLLLERYVNVGSLADVGTGAGFPGIPLKIVRPDLNLLLIDATEKRLKFLNEVINHLQLENVTTLHMRAEDVGRLYKFREQFDTVTARAVARLPVLLEYCLPLVKLGGVCLLAKGAKTMEELQESMRALEVLGGGLTDIKNFSISEKAEHRSIVIIHKVKATPVEYPRRAGIPEKRPILTNNL